MPLRIIILSVVLMFAINGKTQNSNYEVVQNFMEAMKGVDDLAPLVNIPKSLENSSFIVNFYVVGDYDIKEVNENTFEVVFSTGASEKCISVTLEVDTSTDGLIKPGKVQYQELLNKYIIDPWIATSNWCDENSETLNRGEFTSLSGHFSGVLPNEFIMDFDLSGDDIITYEYVVCESDNADHRQGYLVIYDPDRLGILDKLIYSVFNIPRGVKIPTKDIEWQEYIDPKLEGIKFGNSIISFVECESYYTVTVFPDNQSGSVFFNMLSLNPLNFEFEFDIERDTDEDVWTLLQIVENSPSDTIYSGSDSPIFSIIESMKPVKYEIRTEGGQSKFVALNPHLGFQLADREYAIPMSIDLSSGAENFGRTFELYYDQGKDDFVWELKE